MRKRRAVGSRHLVCLSIDCGFVSPHFYHELVLLRVCPGIYFAVTRHICSTVLCRVCVCGFPSDINRRSVVVVVIAFLRE